LLVTDLSKKDVRVPMSQGVEHCQRFITLGESCSSLSNFVPPPNPGE